MTKETGGQAFPHKYKIKHKQTNYQTEEDCFDRGMTLRDYFAGQAIEGCEGYDKVEYVAQQAYRLADAMLKERSK